MQAQEKRNMFLFLVLMLVLTSLVLCLSHKCEPGFREWIIKWFVLICIAGVAIHMIIVTTIWLQTISVLIGGCHILLLTFTLGVIHVVRNCPTDQIDVLCCLNLLRQSTSWFSSGRKAPWKVESNQSGQIDNTTLTILTSLKRTKTETNNCNSIHSKYFTFKAPWTNGKCPGLQIERFGFEPCRGHFTVFKLGKTPIFHRASLHSSEKKKCLRASCMHAGCNPVMD